MHNICHGWFTNPLWSVPKLSLLVFMVSDMSKDGFMQTLNIRFHGRADADAPKPNVDTERGKKQGWTIVPEAGSG